MKLLVLLGFFYAAISFQGWGHGDLHEQIDTLTREIAKTPNNPELYVRRGELYRVHSDWQKALNDFNTANKLDGKLEAIDFLKGRLFFEKKDYQAARDHLNRFIAGSDKSSEAFLVRAKVLRELKLYKESVQDFDKAIETSIRPQPEHFIDRARVAVLADPQRPAVALQGLEEGMKKLGPIITLELEAIEIEVNSGKWELAVSRLDKIIQKSPRKEKWYIQKGEILQKAGKREEAKQAFEDALAAIEKLPPQHRNTKAVMNLQKTASEKLEVK